MRTGLSWLRIVGDLVHLLGLGLRSRRALAAENLFLRKQLLFYRERKVERRRADNPTRLTLVLLSPWFNWREALIVVRPKTLIAWHRQGFRLFWGWKSKTCRQPIPVELQHLIRNHMPNLSGPPGRPRGDQWWATFLQNHATAIVACDFCVAVTATFRILLLSTPC